MVFHLNLVIDRQTNYTKRELHLNKCGKEKLSADWIDNVDISLK